MYTYRNYYDVFLSLKIWCCT